MLYQVGQKVKMLHSRDEGEVVQSYPDGRLLVRLDDQLEVEVPVTEIVAADPSLANIVATSAKKKNIFVPAENTSLVKGVFLVIDRPEETRVDLYLLNNTSCGIVFALSVRENRLARGLVQGTLPKSEMQILLSTTLENLVHYNDLIFQWLYFMPEGFDPLPPVQHNFKLRNKHLLLPTEYNAVLERNTIFINLSAQEGAKSVGEMMRPAAPRPTSRAIGGNGSDPVAVLHRIELPEDIIDLHIEKLVDNPSRFTQREMMDVQLGKFEQALQRAIAHGFREMTIIHGVGNGRLKNEIHRRLGENKFVKQYHLDSFERFGFGATRVVL